MDHNERAGIRLIAICREVDKDTGRIAVYKVPAELDDHTLHCLRIRAMVNPDLRYFATTAAHFRGFEDIITAALKRRTVTKEAIARVGGLVEL